ncbi:hypothetical protein [Nitrosomonas communis]|uniref:hypothetical protein n=1 Tax=Nitrosomonas communis TaxID=44574 RepID=UPI00111532F4|nr:hypothetical protein [Nitrosomonas communis]
MERLRDEHGFTSGDTIVRNYVNKTAVRQKKMFMLLVHLAGHAQVNFGEADGYIGGKLIAFDACYKIFTRVSSLSLIHYQSNDGYSLPSEGPRPVWCTAEDHH